MTGRVDANWLKLMLGALIVVITSLLMSQPAQPSSAQSPTRTPSVRGTSPLDRQLATISALSAGISSTPLELSGTLVYVSGSLGYNELFTMDLATGEANPLLHDSVGKWWPTWSHDGSQIAFMGEVVDENAFAIYVMDADGSHQRRVTPPGLNYACVDWSPDDTQLVMCGGEGDYQFVLLDIYTINVDGTGLRQLTRYRGKDYEAQWSPDGQYIAFSSARGNPADDDYTNDYGQLYVMRTDGSDLRQLTDGEGVNFAPAWSPDGKLIAYAGRCPSQDELSTLCVMNADGTDKHGIDASRFDLAPRWSPDGNYIIVTRYPPNAGLNSAELHVLAVYDDADRQLTNDDTVDILASWKP